MKIKIVVVIIVLVQAAYLFSMCGAQEFKLDAKALGNMQLATPENLPAKKYLGLKDSPVFTLGQIKAEAIFLEIFSMYCPVCQKDAPIVNQLYQLVDTDSSLKDKIKFIGIGTGNTPYEVEVFRKKFNINFPLLPDDDFRVQKISSQDIRTPTFILVRIKGANQLEILKTKIGEIRDAQEFFNSMKQLIVAKSG